MLIETGRRYLPSKKTIETFRECKWASLSRDDILWSSYYLTRQIVSMDVHGDLVECGVFAGTHPAMMVRGLIDAGDISRKIHLFDSFKGIPEPSKHDGRYYSSALDRKNLMEHTVCSLEQCREFLRTWGITEQLLVFHPGWYSDVLPNTQPFPIALLRIDCDLYSSIRLVLEYLYPHLVKYGVCVMDDYSFEGARKAFQELEPGTISPIMWWRR